MQRQKQKQARSRACYKFIISKTDLRYIPNGKPSNPCVDSILGAVCRMDPEQVIPLYSSGGGSESKERAVSTDRPNGWIAVTRAPGKPIEISVGRLRYFQEFTSYYPVEMVSGADRRPHPLRIVCNPDTDGIGQKTNSVFRIIRDANTTFISAATGRSRIPMRALSSVATSHTGDPLLDYLLESVRVDADLWFGADSGTSLTLHEAHNGALVCVRDMTRGGQLLFTTRFPTSPDSVRWALGAGPECSVNVISATVDTESHRTSGWHNPRVTDDLLDVLIVRPLVDIVVQYVCGYTQADSWCFDDLIQYTNDVPGLHITDMEMRTKWMMEVFDASRHLGESVEHWQRAIQKGVSEKTFIVDYIPGFYSRRDALLLRAFARGFIYTDDDVPMARSLGIYETPGNTRPLTEVCDTGRIDWYPFA